MEQGGTAGRPTTETAAAAFSMEDISGVHTTANTTTTAAAATNSYLNPAPPFSFVNPALLEADDDRAVSPPPHLAAQTRGAVFGLTNLSHIEARH
ncbi:hypothetical protein E2C01_090035 [Portunus trituberculatus]|uniref:Uncharacterized protein n=1 Tax=Portunus trituberculatus TaxID=210409 RepID=A0A5B7JP11_PORTR|nr:hypothetical protein [Portunus trituberculatus]